MNKKNLELIYMGKFKIHSKFKPTGDQPAAIDSLVAGIEKNEKYQTLLGVTGSGKTYTMANISPNILIPASCAINIIETP